jgi:hypothetical protein
MTPPEVVPELISYLRSLDAVRDRSQQVFDLALEGKLDHWDWHEEKLSTVVAFCADIIEVGELGVAGSGDRNILSLASSMRLDADTDADSRHSVTLGRITAR